MDERKKKEKEVVPIHKDQNGAQDCEVDNEWANANGPAGVMVFCSLMFWNIHTKRTSARRCSFRKPTTTDRPSSRGTRRSLSLLLLNLKVQTVSFVRLILWSLEWLDRHHSRMNRDQHTIRKLWSRSFPPSVVAIATTIQSWLRTMVPGGKYAPHFNTVWLGEKRAFSSALAFFFSDLCNVQLEHNWNVLW